MAISNNDDVVDSRQVIERIKELEESIEAARAECEAWESLTPEEAEDAIEPDAPDDDEIEELAVLKALGEEASFSPDWPYGESLIRDSYFVTYAEELANETIDLDQCAWNSWPFNEINWGSAAEALQTYYRSVDWDGVTYWVRA